MTTEYVHVKIPKALADKIKKLEDYRNVSEFVIEATRVRLTEIIREDNINIYQKDQQSS